MDTIQAQKHCIKTIFVILSAKIENRSIFELVQYYIQNHARSIYVYQKYHKRIKTNSIQASHVLTHRTTGWTRRRLTSGIGRDRVQLT
jgi:hypothetical protein